MRTYTLSDKIFAVFLYAFVTATVILCLVPMLHLLAVSLSSNNAILSDKVFVFPVGFNTQAYESVFRDASMIRSLFVSIALVGSYTLASMAMTVCAAYPLTKRTLRGRNFLLVFIVITMFFSGGLIPEYLLVRNLHLMNTLWALILPHLVNAFYMIILKTFFQSIPEEIEESARMDGSSHIGTLLRIVLPLSLPILSTLSLFYAVFRWNAFMDALFYIKDSDLYTIQLKLYQMVINSQLTDMTMLEGMSTTLPVVESLKAAGILFATVPILLVYPWLQRYFISGMMIGAVKG